MKSYLLLFLMLCSSTIFGCDCAPPLALPKAQEKEYNQSEHIYIAEIINITADKKTITLRVKEVFKGTLKVDDKFEFKNNDYCEPYIDILGDWLLYGKTINGEFSLNICGLSRSINCPENNRYFANIPPPPTPSSIKNYKSTISDSDKNKSSILKVNALIETEKELSALRKNRFNAQQ